MFNHCSTALQRLLWTSIVHEYLSKDVAIPNWRNVLSFIYIPKISPQTVLHYPLAIKEDNMCVGSDPTGISQFASLLNPCGVEA